MKFFTLALIALLVSACKHLSDIWILFCARRNPNTHRVTKQVDLPNTFGKSTIFGEKVDAGYTELRFISLTEEGQTIFRLTDVDIDSNETTMSRYTPSTTTVNSNTAVNATAVVDYAYGNANTSATIRHCEKSLTSTTPQRSRIFSWIPLKLT